MRRVGTQGWSYREWGEGFYPAHISRTEMLARYAREFPTVEVGDTLFGIPPAPLLREWREAVPRDFVFALRVPRQVTHERPFGHSAAILLRFLDRAALLQQRLGPLLLTLPVGFGPTPDNRTALRRLVASLPRDFMWAMELRWAAWLTGDTTTWLDEHGVAVAMVEDRWVHRSQVLAVGEKSTSRHAYVRWNSMRDRPVQYPEEFSPVDAVLRLWTTALDSLPANIERVFGYVGPGFGGDGLRSARTVRELHGQDRCA